MPAFGQGEKLLVTGSTHDEYGFRRTDDPAAHARLVARLNDKILQHRDRIVSTRSYRLEDAEIAIVAYGFTARSAWLAVDKLRRAGKKAGLLRLRTIWPFAAAEIAALGSSVRQIFVPEMNRGQLAGEIMKYAGCEVLSHPQTDGRIIYPETIIRAVQEL
jgi:2-oxoglutarate ferredoxin oxidoreductase subunit alpha